jgi:imidazole glycerol-phosphate synthase subunit HisH
MMSRANDKNPLRIAVVRTGTANIASILAGLRRAGAEATVTDHAGEVRDASAVVLPGVGSFSAAMRRLRERDLANALRDRIIRSRPTLAICLGMQLLFESSEESPNIEGLAVAKGEARRFTDVPRVPQMGWNAIVPQDGCELLTPGNAYFANSYRIVNDPDGWNTARTDYGGWFTCAMERGPILACQFHPELSGEWGKSLLKRWVERVHNECASAKGGTS